MRSSQGDMRYSSSPIQSDVRSCQGDVWYSYAHKFVMCGVMCGDVRFSGTPQLAERLATRQNVVVYTRMLTYNDEEPWPQYHGAVAISN